MGIRSTGSIAAVLLIAAIFGGCGQSGKDPSVGTDAKSVALNDQIAYWVEGGVLFRGLCTLPLTLDNCRNQVTSVPYHGFERALRNDMDILSLNYERESKPLLAQESSLLALIQIDTRQLDAEQAVQDSTKLDLAHSKDSLTVSKRTKNDLEVQLQGIKDQIAQHPKDPDLAKLQVKVEATLAEVKAEIARVEIRISWMETRIPLRQEKIAGLEAKLASNRGLLIGVQAGILGARKRWPDLREKALDILDMLNDHRVIYPISGDLFSYYLEVVKRFDSYMLFGSPGFVAITADTFEMGSPDSEAERDDDEIKRTVTLSKSFEILSTEVTNLFVEKTLGLPSSESNQNPFQPRAQVATWIETFLAALNAKNDGYTYRLPTEAEWEFAARAGTTGPFSVEGPVDDFAWSRSNANELQDVGQKRPNPWGLYDVHGNVFEVTSDYYTKNLPTGHVSDPVQTSPAGWGECFVSKGGSIASGSKQLRSAYRRRVGVQCTYGVEQNVAGARIVRIKK